MIAAAQPDVQVLERQKPPLNDEETEIWVKVVSSEPADWLGVSQAPILAQYCRHVVHARRIGELLEKMLSDSTSTVKDYDRLLRMQERESRMIASLACKMRITNQSTINQRGNKRMTLAARKPWET